MKRYQREFFFQGPTGNAYDKFRRENIPTEARYRELFDSVAFILNPADAAKENEQGLIRLANDSQARLRTKINDGWIYGVQPHMLPNLHTLDMNGNPLMGTSDNDNLAGWGMTISYFNSVNNRKDFMVFLRPDLLHTDDPS